MRKDTCVCERDGARKGGAEMVRYLPGMYDALGPIPSTTKAKGDRYKVVCHLLKYRTIAFQKKGTDNYPEHLKLLHWTLDDLSFYLLNDISLRPLAQIQGDKGFIS